MTLYDQFPILKSIPLFAAASDRHVEKCFGEAERSLCRFGAGEAIYSSHTESIRVGVLLSGEAQIHSQGGEGRALLKSASTGEMFGVANLYATDTAFPTVIRAKTACEVLFFEGESFRRFLETDPAVLQVYLSFLSKKIVYLNQKIATFTAGDAEHRLAFFLLEHERDGIFTPSHSMTMLASLLGLGRASLYRAIDKLTALSLIEHRDGSLYIPNHDALSAFISAH